MQSLPLLSPARLSRLLITLLCLCHMGTAAEPVLVRDINTTPASSSPTSFHCAGSKLFFQAGSKLWCTEGSAATTRGIFYTCRTIIGPLGDRFLFFDQVGDLFSYDPQRRAGAANTLLVRNPLGYFSVADTRQFLRAGNLWYLSGPGRQVWRSDGTAEGTFAVAAGYAQDPSPLIALEPDSGAVQVRLLTAGQSAYWETDGTAAGTRLSAMKGPWLATVNGIRLFTVNDRQLWKTDGSAAGTAMIREFAAISGAASQMRTPVIRDGFAYFTATDRVTSGGRTPSYELWKSDGTAEGTRWVMNGGLAEDGGRILSSAEAPSEPLLFARHSQSKPELYALTLAEPIRSVRLSGIHGFHYYTTPQPVNSSLPRSYSLPHAWSGGKCYYSTQDLELIVTDGTPGGTTVLSPPIPGGPSRISPRREGGVWFTAEGTGALWVSDGTPSGTRQLPAVLPRSFAGHIVPIAEMAGKIWFGAQDPLHGVELWSSTGSDAGTRMVLDLAPGTAGAYAGRGGALSHGKLLFPANDGTGGTQLWSSDGTPSGTQIVQASEGTEMDAYSDAGPYQGFGEDLIYWKSNNSLWRTDGTTAGTRELFKPDAPWSFSWGPLLSTGSRLLFSQREVLVASDGSVAPPETIALPQVYSLETAGSAGGIGYFYTRTFQNSLVTIRIWRSDGTAAGTYPVRSIDGASGPPPAFQALGSRLAVISPGAPDLWMLDGTADGAYQIPLPAGSRVGAAAGKATSSRLLFAVESATEESVWTSDGTTAGTRALSLRLPRGSLTTGAFHVQHEKLYFSVLPGSGAPAGLWRSDGTNSGTMHAAPIQYLYGIRPAGDYTVCSTPGELYLIRNWDEAPLFVTDLTAHSRGLWGNPPVFAPIGGSLLFTATDTGRVNADLGPLIPSVPQYGAEVFSVPITPAASRGAWERKWFGEGFSPVFADPLADPDNDGLPNLLERAFGTVPLEPTPVLSVPVGSILRGTPATIPPAAPGGEMRAVYLRQRDRAISGLRYTPQFSLDLQYWHNSSEEATVLAIDADVEACAIPFPLLRRGVARFFRVAVSEG